MKADKSPHKAAQGTLFSPIGEFRARIDRRGRLQFDYFYRPLSGDFKGQKLVRYFGVDAIQARQQGDLTMSDPEDDDEAEEEDLEDDGQSEEEEGPVNESGFGGLLFAAREDASSSAPIVFQEETTSIKVRNCGLSEQEKYWLFRSNRIVIQPPTPAAKLPLHPYFLGLWLGDGYRAGTGIANNHEVEVVSFLKAHAKKLKMKVTVNRILYSTVSVSILASCIIA